MRLPKYKKPGYYLKWGLSIGLFLNHYSAIVLAYNRTHEPVLACVVARNNTLLTEIMRAQISQCLGWQSSSRALRCSGFYEPLLITPLANADEVRIKADHVSFYLDKRSSLYGHVEVQHQQTIVNAQTAYIYRNKETNKITKIEFLGEVRYLEPDKIMIARQAMINPQDKSGETVDVLYRFNAQKNKFTLPAWGQASFIKRFANKDYLLRKATYTTCAPGDKAWDIQAQSITLDDANAQGIARHATLRIREWPVLYAPYLSFPTNRARKSGFLMPLIGTSNVGGFDLGLPYYWNIAPNYDLTLTPHLYTKRGVMMGGEGRFLTKNSNGIIHGNFLAKDKAYKAFLNSYKPLFPQLRTDSTNRWSFGIIEHTSFTPDLQFDLSAQKVSDDYYFQDFSNNLATMTQRQLLRQATLTYTTEHWLFRGMGQSYQTLHPLNETPISSVYERLPQFMARGFYYDLPYNAHFNVLTQYDQFHWPRDRGNYSAPEMPQGPRLHLNPILTVPILRTAGYITPSLQWVESYYSVRGNYNTNWQGQTNYLYGLYNNEFNRTVPRYSVEGGLYFERDITLGSYPLNQTLEPRLFYLRVPYTNQTRIPVYDSGYMIFNVDQLLRTNRFSGFDRIGDANQLSYSITSRWLSADTGIERANFSLGQIKYFSPRKVQLCHNILGYCSDNPYTFGYLSPTADFSPLASRAVYHFNSLWEILGDYIWDPATGSTNNADLNLHYQPRENGIISAGYSYLTNGDITQVRYNTSPNDALHQGIVAFSWPLNEKWSTIGAYSYNISKNYSMMSLFGVQYDSCCWAVRMVGGQTFKNLNAALEPRYNNNIYLQVLLKGLGAVGNSDPYNILSTYIPGYNDSFRR